MATEQEIKKSSTLQKEFQSLLDEDFKDRKLKENEIIKATVTEITKNFIVVDCKAKMEGMIPIEEFKNDDELAKLKVGSVIDVYLERIESFKGEIIISRDKARKMKAWKKMEKVFETQEELTGYITGKVKGGFIANVEGLPCFMPSSQIDIRPLKKVFYIGDAFNSFLPTFAQGAGQSIESAHELYNSFKDKNTNFSDIYFKSRSKRIKSIRKRSDLNFFLFHFSSSLMQKIRNFFLQFLLKKKNFINIYIGKIYKN